MRTPGEWEWHTSNSFNRLASGSGPILWAAKYSDGVCGIEWRNQEDADLIAIAGTAANKLDAMGYDGDKAIEWLPALLNALDIAEARTGMVDGIIRNIKARPFGSQTGQTDTAKTGGES